ncbi:MAG: large conductance mechanosensitive channel protein MscL [Candidatus Saccharibacteria bacterium]|nr:large conductance mechanosensitive channel protein MscL [Candidatus Saccharibacteria bacterium]
MKKFLQEFKEFAMRGNVVDLATAVIIGGAFGKIVSSLVNDIIMPIFGAILGGNNLSALNIKVGSAIIAYGNFLQNVIDFLIIALAIFTAIKALKKIENLNPLIKKIKTVDQTKKIPQTLAPTETELLTEIRDLLKKNTKKLK